MEAPKPCTAWNVLLVVEMVTSALLLEVAFVTSVIAFCFKSLEVRKIWRLRVACLVSLDRTAVDELVIGIMGMEELNAGVVAFNAPGVVVVVVAFNASPSVVVALKRGIATGAACVDAAAIAIKNVGIVGNLMIRPASDQRYKIKEQ